MLITNCNKGKFIKLASQQFFNIKCLGKVNALLYKSTMQENENKTPYDAIILGAGAAGLICALTAAKRGLSVALIDHNRHAARKIAISGGGKCNFTNLHMGSAYYVGEQSFIEPALDTFPPKTMQTFFGKHGLIWEEREHGQLFGCQNAKILVKTLVQECVRFNCQFFLEHEILSLNKNNELFNIQCNNNDTKRQFQAKSLVLALGSPAWANIGATDAGLKFAAKFAHTHKPFSPALTSLQMAKDSPFANLSGISLRVKISTAKYECTDDLLFTHTGLSGPAALQASCHWQSNTPVYIDFLPHTSFAELLDAKECSKLFTRNLLCRHMPQRLADTILPEEFARRKIAELSRKVRNIVVNNIHNFSLIPQCKGKMERAEAALGGINTAEVNPWSMESNLEKNLYIIGELLDVVGQLGGYNLHFAFASGHLAGLNLQPQ